MNVVFAGTPEFGLPCLTALMQGPHNLLAVYTQPDRKAGRGRKLQPSAIKTWALQHQIPVYQPVHFKTEETIEELTRLQPDLLVVIAYGLILPKKVLNIPKFGCLNVHASLLPRWRGASPIQQAILHGDKETGITIMRMDVGMDTGDSLHQVSCPIYKNDTAGSLHDRMAEIAVDPLIKGIEDIALNKAIYTPQINHFVTYAPKIQKQDGLVQWEKSAVAIYNQIRAFNPWPVAFTRMNDEVMRIYEAELVMPFYHELQDVESDQSRDVASRMNCQHARPGTILQIDKKGLLIKTGEGMLLVKAFQFPGSRVITGADYLNSNRLSLPSDLVLK